MCEPATIIAATTLAVSAAQAGLGYVGQKAQAKQQAALYAQNAASANTSALNEYDNIGLRYQQEQAAASTELFDARQRALQEAATARTAASESGVEGVSIDKLYQDIDAQSGRVEERLTTNLLYTRDDLLSQAKSSAVNATNQINSVGRGFKVSPLAAGLEIVGAAANAYSTYRNVRAPVKKGK